MQNTILDVRDVPDLLIAKLRSNTISWHEENGGVFFRPAKSDFDLERRMAAFERLTKSHKPLNRKIDCKKEKLEWLDEKYGNIH